MHILLLAIGLLGIAFLGMAFNIVFRKKKFPETHIGHNRDMKRMGIHCAQTMDKIEQKKAKKGLRFKNISLAK